MIVGCPGYDGQPLEAAVRTLIGNPKKGTETDCVEIVHEAGKTGEILGPLRKSVKKWCERFSTPRIHLSPTCEVAESRVVAGETSCRTNELGIELRPNGDVRFGESWHEVSHNIRPALRMVARSLLVQFIIAVPRERIPLVVNGLVWHGNEQV